MKNIFRNLDDLVYRLQLEDDTGNEFLLSDFSDFTIELFTDDINSAVMIDSSYIDPEDNLLRVPANVIAPLHDGIIRLKLHTAISDPEFPDNQFDQTNITDTCYFIKDYTK